MAARLSPLMRSALHDVGRRRRAPWVRELPGGRRTARALAARGLLSIDGGRVVLTMDGRRELSR
jgi:hypothetical protein